MPTLDLSNIVSVAINLSPAAAIRSGFNIGCIIGPSTIISPSTRVKSYANTDAMLADGWQGTEPEYLAAQLYFGQKPTPGSVIIGRQQTGTDSFLQAVQACRAADTSWYGCYCVNATKSDHIAIAPYIETATPRSAYFGTTSDSDVPTGTAGNVLLTLQAAKYTRTLIQYSTTAHAAVGIMGYAMGANNNTLNSAYTLAYKPEVGVTPEALTSTQVKAIKDANGNVYINRGSYYNVFEQGVVSSGLPFDEIINLDILSNNLQAGVMNLLTSISKVPQTEDGVSLIVNALTDPLVTAKNIGFIAPGIWKANTVKNLNTGDALSQGYLIQSDTIASQSASDRASRLAPPIYICIKQAGAMEHVAIVLNVNA